MVTTKLIGFVIGILAWVSAWGLMDLMVHNWSNRHKFWFYTAILVLISLTVWTRPAMLEYF